MNINKIDGEKLRNMLVFGIRILSKNREELDDLNIFPVPDGDTGTNMSLTALSAEKEMEKLPEGPSCEAVVAAVASGSLRGARGNSGVILSQLFRGISKGLKGKKEITTTDMAYAFKCSTETAYKAVMKPKEGTVLTISRAISDKANEIAGTTDDFAGFFMQIVTHSKTVLAQTTNMLPALKAAGVVDAGGKGLIYIIEGMYEGLFKEAPERQNAEDMKPSSGAVSAVSQTAGESIEFGYCTEFFIEKKNPTESQMKKLTSFLEKIGDSIVAVNDEEIIKIHVHTNNPGTVLEEAIKIGPISSVKIDNMRIQHTSLVEDKSKENVQDSKKDENLLVGNPEKLNKEIGIIAVSVGDGINSIFRDLGVDYIIEGGQTMNPSAEDICQTAEKISKENYIILPNNKNIILAAKQAAQLLKETGKNVRVLDTKSIPEGIGAMISMVHGETLDNTADAMSEGASCVRTGLVTEAIKDSEIDGKSIKTGDYLGIIEGKIQFVCESALEAAKKIVDNFSADSELVSVFYGSEDMKAESGEIVAYIEGHGLEAEHRFGGQPVYSYVISAE